MKNERIESLIHRYLEGDCPREVVDDLRKAMEADPSVARLLFRRAEQLGDMADILREAPAASAVEVSRMAPKILFGSRWGAPLAMAASLALVVGGWWLAQSRQPAGLGLRVAEVAGTATIEKGRLSIEDWKSGTSSDGAASDAWSPESSKPVPAVVGMELRQGDRVEVAKGGKVGLKYDAEETRIVLEGATAAFGTEEGGKHVDLASGRIVCSVAPQAKPFGIKTPHVSARVVGTRFSLDVTAPQTRLVVEEGKVELIRGEKILKVEAGESAGATDDGMEMMPKEARPAASVPGGRVWVWGANQFGQLGDGTTSQSSNPVLVPGLDGVIAIAMGVSHTVVLKCDGCVSTWGFNNCGQLGDGTTTNSLKVLSVSGLADVAAIAAGTAYSVALKNDGSVWAWGRNDMGQLGDGTTVNRMTPVEVAGLSGVTAIAAGTGHTVVLKKDGSVWAWGRNDMGQLGDGTSRNRQLRPVQVRTSDGRSFSDVVAIGAGYKHTVALKRDGSVWSWGGNEEGQLGDGTSHIERPSPVPVKSANGSPLSGIIAISIGNLHSVALTADGTVLGWGDNRNGAAGSGVVGGSVLAPVQVRLPDGSPLTGINAIAAGSDYTMVLKADGMLWAWGENYFGQLGDGTSGATVGRPSVQQVKMQDGKPLARAMAIAAGLGRAAAIAAP